MISGRAACQILFDRSARLGGLLLLAIAALAASEGQAKPRSAPAEIVAVAPVPISPAMLAVIDAAITDGRYGTANDLITRSRSTADGAPLQLRVAELILAGGDIFGAASAFSGLVEEAEVAAPALQGLGIVRLRQSNLPAAVAALDAALALDPGLVRAWNARGVVADRQRDWATADAAYARAIAAAPTSPAAYTNRGYSRLLRGRHAEAEIDLARAVAIDPGLATARNNLRFARAMQGRYADAFAGSTREGLAADLNIVGFAAMARGDTATAETYFARALALNKHFDRTAWSNLEFLKQHRKAAPADAAPAAAFAGVAIAGQ